MKDIIEEMRDTIHELFVGDSNPNDDAYRRLDAALDRLEAMQPAASPWRTDVENAPRGVQLVCWQWTPEGNDWHCIGMKLNQDNTWECGEPCCLHDPPIAFAELNPFTPESP